MFAADPLSPVRCKVGPSWIGIYSIKSNRIGIRENWRPGQPIGLFIAAHGTKFLSSFCGLAGYIFLVGVTLPPGSAVALRGFTLLETMFFG